ncbi:ATP-binding protein [Paractinoplanes atraurantiacus]|uniref:ATP-binding protein n=1 Tax=Paractinoplanes atraurantiacus TaxID=1036182 RepID=UPI000BE28483|nr:tetratricopeptide repeat protein [Actinoplanes atraurantiacus]
MGRRRLDNDLVLAIVRALCPDEDYVARWRRALRAVGGEAEAAARVSVQDRLPPELAGFTGRAAELDRIVSAGTGHLAITGMAGVGKTQLAVRAAHLLRERFERVLFVNLRGFHPDPGQPPADPGAVLGALLRLLGVPGRQIPYAVAARAEVFREKCGRALVLLDNAADVEQVRPLLTGAPGCLTLITSRHSLAGLHTLSVKVFGADEAAAFLGRPDEPDAVARIARRCGYLPLALGLVAGHIRATPGWSLTDHADRLDERRQLEGGVELALDLSYRDLPAEQRRLLRLAALHPGQDLDAYAVAALAGDEPHRVEGRLDGLCGDHLLSRSAPGRYTFHDLVRAYAVEKGQDEDSPRERRAALTKLFDYYLAASTEAMDVLHPVEAHRRPRVATSGILTARPADAGSARHWLDTERATLVAVTAHMAGEGWPGHATGLARILFRYLNGGHNHDAVTVHGLAHSAAEGSGDLAGQGHALTDLGTALWRLGQGEAAADSHRRAVELFRRTGDAVGQARALLNLGVVVTQLGLYQEAADHFGLALVLYRQSGDPLGEGRALARVGYIEQTLGRHDEAAEHFAQALALCRANGDRMGEGSSLISLGEAETELGRYEPAGEHLFEALALFQKELGDRTGEASALYALGMLGTRRGDAEATGHHRQALAIFRETGYRDGEAAVLNGLGEAVTDPAEALAHHTEARAIAEEIGARELLARAHAGLGRAHRLLGHTAEADRDDERAAALYDELRRPAADSP